MPTLHGYLKGTTARGRHSAVVMVRNDRSVITVKARITLAQAQRALPCASASA